MDNNKKEVVVVGSSKGQCVSIQGGTYRIVLSGAQTGGTFATIDMLVPPGGGPGPHAHSEMQETFLVTEGEVEFTSESGSSVAVAGSYIFVPKGGAVHCFKNKSDKPARLLCTVVPAGLEEFFLEIGEPVAYDKLLPARPMDPERMEKLTAIGARFGQSFYPPDYLDKV